MLERVPRYKTDPLLLPITLLELGVDNESYSYLLYILCSILLVSISILKEFGTKKGQELTLSVRCVSRLVTTVTVKADA